MYMYIQVSSIVPADYPVALRLDSRVLHLQRFPWKQLAWHCRRLRFLLTQQLWQLCLSAVAGTIRAATGHVVEAKTRVKHG